MEDMEVFKRNSSVQEFKPAPNFQEFCFLIIIKMRQLSEGSESTSRNGVMSPVLVKMEDLINQP